MVSIGLFIDELIKLLVFSVVIFVTAFVCKFLGNLLSGLFDVNIRVFNIFLVFQIGLLQLVLQGVYFLLKQFTLHLNPPRLDSSEILFADLIV